MKIRFSNGLRAHQAFKVLIDSHPLATLRPLSYQTSFRSLNLYSKWQVPLIYVVCVCHKLRDGETARFFLTPGFVEGASLCACLRPNRPKQA